MIKKIAVLTSGGDAPGMNAAIRAVVRMGISAGLEVYGIYDGYRGLYEGKIERMYRKSVSEKINRGGTFLGTDRLKEFAHPEIRETAIENLQIYGIDALVVIGGDGTLAGAYELEKMGFPTAGIPATIDNDINGSDYAIGFDTALTTIVDAVDKLRDTSSSHRRCSIIEVMGRNCGALAVNAGISVGAEMVITSETGYDPDILVDTIIDAARSKRHAIVLVAEKVGNVEEMAELITASTPFSARSVVLGHVQRGGSPTPRDRILASCMGVKAVKELLKGNSGFCVCSRENKLIPVSYADAMQDKRNRVEDKIAMFKELW